MKIPEGLKIRAARKEDIPSLTKLANELGHPTTVEEVAARFEAATRTPDCAVFVAELAGGGIAGFVELACERLLDAPPRVDVAGLVVADTHRGGGIGRLLMARGEEWTLEHGFEIIHLRTNVKRAAAHAFYERIGYRHTKTQKTFVKALKARK
jgi:GNAT superfamily N-acetyltransferase